MKMNEWPEQEEWYRREKEEMGECGYQKDKMDGILPTPTNLMRRGEIDCAECRLFKSPVMWNTFYSPVEQHSQRRLTWCYDSSFQSSRTMQNSKG